MWVDPNSRWYKVSRKAVENLVYRAHDDLKRTNNRHPKSFEVRFVSKPNLGISVPDFLLGVLGK